MNHDTPLIFIREQNNEVKTITNKAGWIIAFEEDLGKGKTHRILVKPMRHRKGAN